MDQNILLVSLLMALRYAGDPLAALRSGGDPLAAFMKADPEIRSRALAMMPLTIYPENSNGSL